MLNKKIIGLGLVGIMSTGLLVGCNNDSVDTSSTADTTVEQSVNEQKHSINKVIYSSEYFDIYILDTYEDSDFIGYEVRIKNKVEFDALFNSNIMKDDKKIVASSMYSNKGKDMIGTMYWKKSDNMKTVDDLKNMEMALELKEANDTSVVHFEINLSIDEQGNISVLDESTIPTDNSEEKSATVESQDKEEKVKVDDAIPAYSVKEIEELDKSLDDNKKAYLNKELDRDSFKSEILRIKDEADSQRKQFLFKEDNVAGAYLCIVNRADVFLRTLDVKTESEVDKLVDENQYWINQFLDTIGKLK